MQWWNMTIALNSFYGSRPVSRCFFFPAGLFKPASARYTLPHRSGARRLGLMGA